MSKFYWFGDSWIAGDELELTVPADQKTNFVYAKLVSDHFAKECVNCGVSGSGPSSLVHEFDKVAADLSPMDTVFFGLSAYHRAAFFDHSGVLLQAIPGSNHNQTRSEHADKWFKFFDNHYQRVYNYDSAVNFLYLWTKSIGVDAYFYNIFSTVPDRMLTDLVDPDAWLLPRDRCVSDFIMHLDGNCHGYVITDDCAEITTQDWLKQKHMLEQYVRPGHAHPNRAGHAKIAQHLIEILKHE